MATSLRTTHLRTALDASFLPVFAATLFAGWLTYEVLAGQPNLQKSVFGQTLGQHLAYGAVFAGYAGSLLIRRSGPKHLPFDGALGLLVAALLLATVASISRTISLETALLWLAPLVLLFVVNDLSFLTADRLVRMVVGVAALVALICLAGVILQYVRELQLISAVNGELTLRDFTPRSLPRSRAVFHPNVAAMVFNLALPFAVLLIARPPGVRDRLFGIACLLVLLPALFFTQSRGGWLGTMAGGGTFAFLMLYSRFEAARRGREFRLRLSLPVLAAAAGLFVILAGLAFVAAEKRPAWLTRDTLSLRLEASARALDAFAERPLLGTGPNTYGLVYEANNGNNPVDNVHPHNTYLSILVDTGLVGGLAVAVALVAFTGWLWRAFLVAGREKRLVIAVCSAALASLPVHGMFDSPQLWNPVLVMLVLVVAVACRVSEPVSFPSRRRRSRLPVSPRWLPLALMPLLVAGWFVFDKTHESYNHSLELLAAGRLVEAADSAAIAAGGRTSSAAYELQAGVTAALLYQQNGDAAALEDARERFEQAVDKDPYSAIGYANLTQTALLLGDVAGATEAADQALRYSPKDATIATLAATIYERAGLLDRALSAYALAIAIDPTLSQASFWQTTPARLTMRPAAIAASGVKPCTLGSSALLYGAYDDDLQPLADACAALVAAEPENASYRVGMALTLYGLGRFEESTAQADEALRLAPRGTGAYLAAAISAAAAGDLDVVRSTLLDSVLYTGTEARYLLALTYEASTTTRQISRLLSLPASSEPMPASLRRLLPPPATATGSFANGSQYRLQENYFRLDLLRQPPPVILLPGDWSLMVSPRAALVAAALALP